MFARIYLILGSLLLAGYALAAVEGSEWTSAVRLATAPPPGSTLRSSGGSWYWFHTSSSSGGRGSGVGAFGGK